MMEASELLDIYVREDDSVQKKLTKKAIKLQKQYYKRRKINEKFINKKSPLKKAISIFFDVVCIAVAAVCGLMCFCNISSRIQNLPPSIGGYMAMQIVSGSMRASGFEIGDSVMIKSVNTDTLKTGDKIAFYVFVPSYQNFREYKCKQVTNDEIGELEYNVSVKSFLGIQNPEIQEAAKYNSRRVFHEIIAVYEDADGVRWFKTKGTSNATKDSWTIKETMVIGAYNDSDTAQFMSMVINTMTSSVGTIIVLMIPLVIIAVFIVGLCMKDVHTSMLENEIVEEKRKLTDDICVRNKVGYQMSNKTKYKVLATAAPEEKLTYIGLLWKDGKEPNALKKYYLRKRMLIKPLEEKNALHRECEKLFEEGENPKNIAKYYQTESERIEKKYENLKEKIKSIHESNEKMKEEEAKREEELKAKKKKFKLFKSKDKKEIEQKVQSKEVAAKNIKTTSVKPKAVKTSNSTKETGVKAKANKPTVNKKSTAKDSSSKGKSSAKKPVSKTARLNKPNKVSKRGKASK